MTEQPAPLARWHEVFEAQDPAMLDGLLAEDCVFRSPAVHTPQEGKELSMRYLTAAMAVLGPSLRYEHEWWDESSAVLEFIADLDGLTVHGVDMIRWGDDGRFTEFTVMVRPFKGLTALMSQMGEQLESAGGASG